MAVAALLLAILGNLITNSLPIPSGWLAVVLWLSFCVLAGATIAWEVRRDVSDDHHSRPRSEEERLRAATEYLAHEVLHSWQGQAKARKLTTPSPVAVRWRWAGEDVAAPGSDILPGSGGRVLTAGVITRLRQQLYEALGGGAQPARLIILGGPGAGKTSAMLLLLIDILRHRAPDSSAPVPMWLTLGGWNPHTTPLRVWAAAIMARDYPGLRAPEYNGMDTAADLIRTQRIALFLDGLDEMPPELQATALDILDAETQGLHLVMSSRSSEFRRAVQNGRLYGAAVIDVLPVAVDQAETFLLAEQLQPRRGQWQNVVSALRSHPDSAAGQTLVTPLALGLARETYLEANPEELLDSDRYPTPQALLEHLLARSLYLSYDTSDDRTHAEFWLAWIAHHLGDDRDLRWWDIPKWGPLYIPMTQGRRDTPQTLFFGGFKRADLTNFLFLLLVGLPCFEAIFALISRFDEEKFTPAMAIMAAAAFMLVLLFSSLIEIERTWRKPVPTTQASTPVSSYQADLRRSLITGSTTALTAGIAVGLSIWLVENSGNPEGHDAIWTAIGMGFLEGSIVGGIFALYFAGPALAIRIVEGNFKSGGRPVRFLPLLQNALHQQVLRQVGTVYQFRHAALQDHLRTRWDSLERTTTGAPDHPVGKQLPAQPGRRSFWQPLPYRNRRIHWRRAGR